jgi:glucose-1-phosphate thymidylyltransferase
MKGILLAGGLGTRLYPSTYVVSKLLLPVYDKPMIYYSLSTLLLTGIRDILIISTAQYLPLLKNLLNDGSQWGINLSYAEQAKPRGIADAFIIGEKFIGNHKVALILGDNIFHGAGLEAQLHAAIHKPAGATLFAYYVDAPQNYGVVEFDKNQQPVSLVEKPKIPTTHYAITGLYFYDNQVVEMAKNLPPSARNELEITDINNLYLQRQQVAVEILGRGFTWLDAGTHESLLKASIYVEVIETRQGLKIGCPEEVAWRKGYISNQQLETLAQNMKNLNYKEYLLKIMN